MMPTVEVFGPRFHGPRRPAWAYLGPTFEPPVPAKEATQQAQLDYEVGMFPITIEAYGQEVETGAFAVIREPTASDKAARYFGSATSRYQPLQNMRVAAALDAEAGVTAQYPAVAGGYIGAGELAYWVLRGETALIGDTELTAHFVISNGHDTTRGCQITYMPVEERSQAVLVTGRRGTLATTVAHRRPRRQGTRSPEQELVFQTDFIAQVQETYTRQSKDFELLTRRRLNVFEADAILARVFQAPAKPQKVELYEEALRTGRINELSVEDRNELETIAAKWEYYAGRPQAYAEAAKELYNTLSMERPKFSDTAWLLYVACVETSDWRQGMRGEGREVNVAESCLFGARAKEKARAFAEVMALV